jgi:APA family basic amino acid/polyamine antiporter
VIAGAAAGLTAYSYARFGRLRPLNSPEFQYTAMAFGARAGFVAGWLMLAADLLAAAAVALGFGGYLAHLAGTGPVMSAVGLLLVSGVIVYAGIAGTVGLAVLLTVVEAAGLVFVIVVGVPYWGDVNYLEMPHGVGGVWSAASLIFFAYIGFDELGNFAEEMRDPERDLPRALLIAMTVTTTLYVLVVVSAVAAVGWRALAASGAPLAVLARRAIGPWADSAVSAVALCATANTVLLLLVSASRSLYGMAGAGVLPHWLARVGGRTATPTSATLVTLVLATALVLSGDLTRVAAMTDGAVLLSFVMVNAALVWLALRRAIARRRADLFVPAAAAVLCGSLLAHTGRAGILAAVALAAVGLLVSRRAVPAA